MPQANKSKMTQYICGNEKKSEVMTLFAYLIRTQKYSLKLLQIAKIIVFELI